MNKMIVVLACVLLCAPAYADKKKSLEQWTSEQRTPSVIDGVTIYRPTIANGKFSYGDIVNYATSTSNDLAFTRALVYVIQQLNSETESIESIDFENHRFVCSREIVNEEGSNTYAFTEAFQFENGIMTFMSPEIIVKYKDKLVINKRVPFHKLDPENKESHFAFVEEFSLMNSRFIAGIVNAVESLNVVPVKNWAAVSRGKAVNGMNTTEVLLTEGKPDNITESANHTKWMYGAYRIVIFDNGIVERVVNF